MTKSKVFFVLCLAFIAGIGLHSFFAPDQRILEPFSWYVGFLFFGVAGLLWLCNPSQHPLKLKGGVVGLCLAFVFLGLFRYAQITPVIDGQHILSFVNQEVAVRGVVNGLPRKREKTTAYVVRLTTLNGKLLLTVPPLPTYRFDEELFIKCTPQPLSQYEKWAVREGVSASCVFPEHVARMGSLTLPSPLGRGVGVRAMLYHARDSFDARLRKLFPDPYGGLLAGILYGDTSGISRELREAFRITGLAHLTALSGYNISIISWVLTGGLIWVGLTRKQALPVTLLLIFAFVLATGAEASVVRAAIMGSLVSLAQGIGRARHPRNALALAGVAMLAVNPRLLRFDLGFLLSFVATVALLYLADDIERRTLVRKLPEIWEIRKAAAASVTAITFTTPLLLYHTGILGPFALLVNVLTVPVVPAVMALGSLTVLADLLWHPLGIGLSFLTRVPLVYMVGVAEWFAKFGAFHVRLSFFAAAILFGVMAWAMWQWKKQGRLHK